MHLINNLKNLVNDHLERFSEDQKFVTLLLENAEFSPDDKSYSSWLKFNLNGIERGQMFINTIEKRLGSLAGLNVLDIGAGAGGASIAFHKHGCNVTAVELDDTRLKWLRTRLRDHKIPIQTITKPIEEIDFKDKYDLIYCNAVLEHVSNWKSFLHRLLEINKGHIYLSWPNKFSILQIISDSHYGLFGATFLTGKLGFLQHYYLKIMKINRNAWVTSVPTLFTVRRFIRNYSSFRKVEHFLPSSFTKIQYPEKINYKPARIVLMAMKKWNISHSFIIRFIVSTRKTHDILISK